MKHRPQQNCPPLIAPWRLRGAVAYGTITLIAFVITAGCSELEPRPPAGRTAQASPAGTETIAPGVVHRSIPTADSEGIDVIDLDLPSARAHLTVGVDNIHIATGAIVATAITPGQWINRGALAAINGGYFGEEHADAKAIVGLLVKDSRVRHAAPALTGQGASGLPPGHYARSAFGLMPNGRPEIVWAATAPGNPQRIQSFGSPEPDRTTGRRWTPRDAIGCGPTLFTAGRRVVTDRKERLVSEGALPRTFVAYDRVNGIPRHVILGIASAATYDQVANYVADYFPKYNHSKVWAAMCFDGGASTQMSYRVGNVVNNPRDTGVSVTDCLLVMPN